MLDDERRGRRIALGTAAATILGAALAWWRRIPDQNHDLHGRTVMVVGGDDGVGRATATRLAGCGARVVVTAPEAAGAGRAAREVRAASGADDVEPMAVDPADLASIRRFAVDVRDRLDRLDRLVIDVAQVHPRRRETVDGFERTIGVTHLGPFLLTMLLLPLLLESEPARIVIVGSAAHRGGDLELDDLHRRRRPYEPLAAYADATLATVLFTRELARRLEGTGVTVNVCHPGVVADSVAPDPRADGALGLAVRLGRPLLLSPEQGAVAPVHLAASPDVAGTTGGYWYRRMQVPATGRARDAELARRLWEVSADEVGLRQENVSR